LHEIRLLVFTELKIEAPVVMIDNLWQCHETAIMIKAALLMRE